MSPPSVEIIAEIANAHQGNAGNAISLAEAALAAGANAVKFQVYSVGELLVRNHPRFKHFQQQSFSADIWKHILSKVVPQGRVYCDVFGLDALEIATRADVYGYKVHSSDLGNICLLQTLRQTKKRILLAVGGSTIREIGRAVATIVTKKAPRPVLMHGFQSYPTAIEDTCLSRLDWLKGIFGKRCDIGYMDHVAGDDPLVFTLPLMAIGMGVTVIEKHITLERNARGVDYYSSLNPDEFARFVETVRRMEQAIGDSPEKFSKSEREYRRQIKKHWVTVYPLKAGHVLDVPDLVMKRVDDDLTEVVEFNRLVGRPLLHDCPGEYLLTGIDVPQTVWALVIARLRSSRLPGKSLLDVGGMPALLHLLERLKQAKTVNKIVLCTTEESEDNKLVAVARGARVGYFRGPTEDVLGRMLGALKGQAVDVVLRVTGDDILIDPDYVDRAVLHHLKYNAEYSDMKALPSGTEVEVFDVSLLRDIWKAAKDAGGTEYLTTYIVDHRDQFRTTSVPVDQRHAWKWRLTMDTPEDYQVIKFFLEAMRILGKAVTYRLDDIVDFFTKHPEILELNTQVRQRSAPPEVCTDLKWRRLV